MKKTNCRRFESIAQTPANALSVKSEFETFGFFKATPVCGKAALPVAGFGDFRRNEVTGETFTLHVVVKSGPCSGALRTYYLPGAEFAAQ